MKFTKGQRVTIIANDERGSVVHSFTRKLFAEPDTVWYTVQTASGMYECAEEELAA